MTLTHAFVFVIIALAGTGTAAVARLLLRPVVRWLARIGEHLAAAGDPNDDLGPLCEPAPEPCEWCDDKHCNDPTRCTCGDNPCGKSYCKAAIAGDIAAMFRTENP